MNKYYILVDTSWFQGLSWHEYGLSMCLVSVLGAQLTRAG